MPDHDTIYARHAKQYQRLVSKEDYQHHILPAIRRVRPLQGIRVVELGAGTGRLTRILAPLSRWIVACDLSAHMLETAQCAMREPGSEQCQLVVADHRALPLSSSCADLVISGWSICYTVVWHPDHWVSELGRVLAEIGRVLCPGGAIVLLETMGTGTETPQAPVALREYYQFLRDRGFSYSWIRTDYRFQSAQEARELTRFFFGDEMCSRIRVGDEVILPECTGIWWLWPWASQIPREEPERKARWNCALWAPNSQ